MNVTGPCCRDALEFGSGVGSESGRWAVTQQRAHDVIAHRGVVAGRVTAGVQLCGCQRVEEICRPGEVAHGLIARGNEAGPVCVRADVADQPCALSKAVRFAVRPQRAKPGLLEALVHQG